MGISRQEYWGGLPFPSPGDLPDPGIKPGSPALQAESLLSEPLGTPLLKQGYHKLTCSMFQGYLLLPPLTPSYGQLPFYLPSNNGLLKLFV